MSSDDGPLPPGSIRMDGVVKAYDRTARKLWATANPWKTPRLRQEHLALEHVDFHVEPGESVGLIGANGAGKSTMLKLLAGVVSPTRGTVQCVGSIGSMIELGLGFHPEQTGRENALGTATILGLPRDQAEAVMPDIIEFSGIADAMDTPLKHYSTGMQARLGFAVAVHVPTDLLLIDEVLAVGDSEFQARCVDRILAMHERGTTLLFVSHAVWLVAQVCERVVQVRHGRIVDDGPSTEVIRRYLSPAPVALARADDPTMSFRSLDIATPHLKPWGHLELAAEVVVTGDTTEPTIAIDIAWANHSPDKSIARVSTALPPELRVPGGYRLRGRSNEIPCHSGHAGVQVALIDERTQRLLDLSRAEFVIDGVVSRQGPQLAAEIDWTLVRVEDREREPSAEAAADPLATGVAADHLTVQARNLTKRFHSGLRRGGVRTAIPRALSESEGDTLALDGVNLDVPPGQSLGIIGPNGSGKSTFLKVVAGVIAPTSGVLTTRGSIVPMLELGIGFHLELTGEENLRQTAALLGIPKSDIPELLPKVLEFAGIGDAVKAPMKQYSSGMKTRLGLALAVHCEADLILIDEALAVGDRPFQKQAITAVQALVERGATAIFVSHDLGLIEEMCDRVIRLEQGRVVDDGRARDVVDRAGGVGWQAGVSQITSAVRVDDLQLANRVISPGAAMVLTGVVEVFEPSPTIRLEFAYLSQTGNPNELSRDHIKATTIFSRIVEPAGGPLSEVGRYRFTARVPKNPVLGEMYVLVTAVNERDASVTAEAWQDLKVGTRVTGEVVMIPLEIEWTIEATFDPAEVSA